MIQLKPKVLWAVTTGTPTGSSRVIRGGSWYNFGRLCRSAYRSRIVPSGLRNDLGFRLALVPSKAHPPG